jgi:two-component system, NarL family, invasion response regulator UvrY
MEDKRVIIVEDHPVCAQATKNILESHGYDIVDICDASPQAVASIERLQPALVILDYHLRQGTGVEVRQKVKIDLPTQYVYLTQATEFIGIERMYATNPSAILFKSETDKLMQVIHQVREGRRYFSADVMDCLTSYYQLMLSLEKVEQELFKCFCQKEKDANIAEHLDISDRHLRRLKQSLISKLGKSQFQQYCC